MSQNNDGQRGAASVQAFAAAMLATLNNDHNRNKPDWKLTPFRALMAKLREERREVDREEVMRHTHAGADWERVAAECVDEANAVMMVWEWAMRRLEQQQGKSQELDNRQKQGAL